MIDLLLTTVSRCIARGDREVGLQLLRGAISDGQIRPPDGIELMLVIREGSAQQIEDAIAIVRTAPPGSFRYVPTPDQYVA